MAVESLNGQLLVLDAGYGSLTRLVPTAFGENVRQAIALFNDGRYEDARESWEAILKQDAGYELANVGMGKVYEKMVYTIPEKGVAIILYPDDEFSVSPPYIPQLHFYIMHYLPSDSDYVFLM